MNKLETNIRYLLYEHPLYRAVSFPCSRPLQILIVGGSPASFSFLKQALQLSVIHPVSSADSFSAVFRVLCTKQQCTAAEQFLQSAPALKQFFYLKYSEAKSNPDRAPDRAFGELEIKAVDNLPEILRRILSQKQQADYIFLSAGKDADTQELIRICEKAGTKAVVIADQTGPAAFESNTLPYFSAFSSAAEPDQALSDHQKQLRRMAQNLHWIWNHESDTFQKKMKAFQEQFDSSLASAASIQYKLYFYYHIDLHQTDAYEAARLFSENKSKELIEDLGWAEHRRWCMERIFEGYMPWDTETAYEDAAKLGDSKDKKAKLHLCLRQRLRDSEIRAKGKMILHECKNPAWSQLNLDDFPDPLDELSLRFHAARLAQYQIAEQHDQELKKDYQFLERAVAGKPDAVTVFQNWKLCIQRILTHKDRYAILLYPEADKQLSECLTENQNKKAEGIRKNTDYAISALQRKDFRYIDTAFSVHIPHILTYSYDLSIVVPVSPDTCDAKNPTAVFRNFSAIYALEPKEGHFLIFVQSKQEMERVLNVLQRISDFLQYKKFRTELTAHFFCPKVLFRTKIPPQIKPQFQEAKHFSDAVEAAKALCTEWSVNHCTYAVQSRGDSALSGALAVYAADIPHFTFDAARVPDYTSEAEKSPFSAVHTANGTPQNAMIFDYIRIEALRPLLIGDLARLAGAEIRHSEQPEYTAYCAKLFDWFENHQSEWKQYCDVLNKRDPICGVFPFREKDSNKMDQTKEYFVSKHVDETLLYSCFREMENAGIIREYKFDPNRRIISIKIRSSDGEKLDGFVKKLLDNDSDSSRFDWYFNPKDDKYYFTVKTLNAALPYKKKNKQNKSSLKEVDPESSLITVFLPLMEELGLIKEFHRTAECCSFVYTSYQSKEILTNSGRLFEIFLYCSLLEKMPNLMSSAEIIWDADRDQKNELDLIGICGYQTVIIEAKTTTDTSTDAKMLYKINCIANQIGINPRILLVDFTEKQQRNFPELGSVFGIDVIMENSLEAITKKIIETLEPQ